MVDLDSIIFGYRRASVSNADVSRLVNFLLKSGISADVTGAGEFIIKERYVKLFKAQAAGRIRYEMGGVLGIPSLLAEFKRRTGIIAAVALVFLASLFTSGMIWDVRVEGNERLSDSDVISALNECGFEIGDIWRGIDKNLTETDVQLNFPDIAWISINRRGTVAYVRIKETEDVSKEDDAPSYSNIVADRDAVIEDITVESGVALVRKGDVVRKGDILISGVVENDSGTHFCRAEGSVIAQAVTTLEVEATRNGAEKRELDEKIYEIRLKIFKISINIFKNYGICLNEYDIIEDEKEYFAFGRAKIPLKLTVTRRKEYVNDDVLYSDSEITEMARSQMNDRIREAMIGCDVVKLKSSGAFVEGAYVLVTEIVYYTDIASEREFEVS